MPTKYALEPTLLVIDPTPLHAFLSAFFKTLNNTFVSMGETRGTNITRELLVSLLLPSLWVCYACVACVYVLLL